MLLVIVVVGVVLVEEEVVASVVALCVDDVSEITYRSIDTGSTVVSTVQSVVVEKKNYDLFIFASTSDLSRCCCTSSCLWVGGVGMVSSYLRM